MPQVRTKYGSTYESKTSILGARCAAGAVIGGCVVGLLLAMLTPGCETDRLPQVDEPAQLRTAPSRADYDVDDNRAALPPTTRTSEINADAHKQLAPKPQSSVSLPGPSPEPSSPAVANWGGEPCLQGASAANLKQEAGNEKDIDRNYLRLLEAVRDAGAKAGPRSVFLDVGANKGEFSRNIVKAWPGSRYYLFEMMPQLIQGLESAMDALGVPRGSFTVVKAAVGDEPGKQVPILGNSKMGSGWTGASLVVRDQLSARKFDEVLGHATTVALGEWASNRTISSSMGMEADVPFMKVDTEGFDGNVFRGMTKPYDLLGSGKVKSIFFELNKMSKKTDMPPGEQFKLLQSKGFDTYLFTTKRLVRISGECFNPDDYLDYNFYTRNALALPKGQDFSCCVLSLYDGKQRQCTCA